MKSTTTTILKLQPWRRIAIFVILLATPASITADVVADWNAIAVQASVTAARPGPTGFLDIAMVQAAVYDAVQAIERRYEPYYVEIKGASGSPVAAAAKAAHDVLVHLFPAQASSLDTTYQQYLSDRGLAANDPGVEVGATAAAGIIALRACDGSFPVSPPPFIGGTDPGVWRPTPPAFAPMIAPWLGSVTPFTLTRPSQFRAGPHPALTSREYARDYNEVKALGALNNSSRTPEQTDMAHFWNANYMVILNQALRDIAGSQINDIARSARLFALADLAIADALITAWNTKNYYVFWRPSTAIQEGNNDGNPRTVGDPTWMPLIANPPYPDYTSGANNVTSAWATSLILFFGRDHMAFSVTTTNIGPTIEDTRTYRRFSDVAEEVVNARIYEGIHFRFADEEARTQGRQVATWIYRNFLRPLDKDDDDRKDDDDHRRH
jgi:PAP2 superfamily